MASSLYDLQHYRPQRLSEYRRVPICPSILPSLCSLDRSLNGSARRVSYRAAGVYLELVHQLRRLACTTPSNPRLLGSWCYSYPHFTDKGIEAWESNLPQVTELESKGAGAQIYK